MISGLLLTSPLNKFNLYFSICLTSEKKKNEFSIGIFKFSTLRQFAAKNNNYFIILIILIKNNINYMKL